MATKSKSKQRTSAGKRPATKKTAVKPKAKTPVKSSTKPKAAVRKKGTAAMRRWDAATKPQNIFAGASEISITENKIAVTRSVSKNVDGKYSERTTREYYEKTPANMRAFNDVANNSAVKKITVKLK